MKNVLMSCASIASALLPIAAAAQTPPALSLEHQMLLRCSAAFALVSNRQASGEAAALRYPAMAERGQTFFVFASVRVMDEAGLDRAQISAALSAEAQSLVQGDALAQIMPPCLRLLEGSGI